MILLQNLTDSADQIVNIQMPDGSIGTLELIFLASIQRWIYNFTHPKFTNGMIQGQMLCQHPNILRNFKNIINFGMSIISSTGNDPVGIEDFVNGNISIYILDASDVQYLETSIFTGAVA